MGVGKATPSHRFDNAGKSMGEVKFEQLRGACRAGNFISHFQPHRPLSLISSTLANLAKLLLHRERQGGKGADEEGEVTERWLL